MGSTFVGSGRASVKAPSRAGNFSLRSDRRAYAAQSSLAPTALRMSASICIQPHAKMFGKMTQSQDTSQAALQSDEAYRRLIEEIRRGELLPGARLRETDLAVRLGISRTPVREAIRQLEADGLVVHLPRQGASIRSLDYAEIAELYEMRAVLEGTAARLAARSASDMELAELSALNEEFAAAARLLVTGSR